MTLLACSGTSSAAETRVQLLEDSIVTSQHSAIHLNWICWGDKKKYDKSKQTNDNAKPIKKIGMLLQSSGFYDLTIE